MTERYYLVKVVNASHLSPDDIRDLILDGLGFPLEIEKDPTLLEVLEATDEVKSVLKMPSVS